MNSKTANHLIEYRRARDERKARERPCSIQLTFRTHEEKAAFLDALYPQRTYLGEWVARSRNPDDLYPYIHFESPISLSLYTKLKQRETLESPQA